MSHKGWKRNPHQVCCRRYQVTQWNVSVLIRAYVRCSSQSRQLSGGARLVEGRRLIGSVGSVCVSPKFKLPGSLGFRDLACFKKSFLQILMLCVQGSLKRDIFSLAIILMLGSLGVLLSLGVLFVMGTSWWRRDECEESIMEPQLWSVLTRRFQEPLWQKEPTDLHLVQSCLWRARPFRKEEVQMGERYLEHTTMKKGELIWGLLHLRGMMAGCHTPKI